MGYGKQTEHTTSGLSDIFQTTVGKMIFTKIIGGLCVITPKIYFEFKNKFSYKQIRSSEHIFMNFIKQLMRSACIVNIYIYIYIYIYLFIHLLIFLEM